jgi:formate dehydrogenase maturation protein FdhE
MLVTVLPPPPPSRHRRVACNSCCRYELGGLPGVKVVFLKGLSLNFVILKELASVSVRSCRQCRTYLRMWGTLCLSQMKNATAWVTFVLLSLFSE